MPEKKKRKLPKTLFGVVLILGGAAISTVPVIQAAGPWLMKLGFAAASVGLLDKGRRAMKKQDPLEHEKQLLQKNKPEKGGTT